VSSVLSGRRGVSPALTERVLRAVEEVGYRRNLVAQSLRDQRTRTIGVSVPDITDPFFNGIVRSVDAEAFAAGYHVLLVSNDERSAVERHRVEQLVARQVDGLIVVPTEDEVAFADALVRERVPAVFVDRGSPTLPFDLVGVDDFRAAYDGTRYLCGLGHRRVAAVGTSTGLRTIRRRLAGFHAAMHEAGVAEQDRVVLALGLGSDDATDAIVALLRDDDPPTALFCLTNRIAVHAVRAVHQLGLRVPTDLSILGFDDVDWVSVVHPAVSVVAQPLQTSGAGHGPSSTTGCTVPSRPSNAWRCRVG
jgi:LacI family transcriptional regulator